MTLEEIYLEFDQKLRGFIQRRVGDQAAAEDILQDVYLKIHTHMQDVREPERMGGWIFQVTRNQINDYYRRQKPEQELSEWIAAQEEEVEDALADLTGSVRGMLNCLPEKYREALTLTEMQGLTQQALAQRLGLSLSGAKSRVQRGREKLKAAFLDCCHFEFDRLGKVVHYEPKCARCASGNGDCREACGG